MVNLNTLPHPPQSADPFDQPLRELILGPAAHDHGLPPLVDLCSAIVSLAEGRSHKALLPLTTQPAEVALVRDGDDVAVSYYSTESVPDVVVWDRRVAVPHLLDAVRETLRQFAPQSRRPHSRLYEQASHAVIRPRERFNAVRKHFGKPTEAPNDNALSFGFQANIPQPVATAASSSDRADIHSLLFPGRLWGYARGRRIELAQGPIFLAAQKMLIGARGLVEAAEAGKSVNLRLRSGTFGIGLRHARAGDATVTLTADHDTVTISSLELREVTVPILALMSELVRTLVSVDRSQGRNLRIRTIREEVRRLRRSLRNQTSVHSFLNSDPERLRLHAPTPPVTAQRQATPLAPSARPARLRFTERWRFDVEELDANATFLCGDRLIIASGRRIVAVDRNDGQAIWVRSVGPSRAFMAAQTLVRVDLDGRIELCGVEDGESFAQTEIAPTVGRNVEVIHIGGPSLPPAALVTEGSSRLVAVDLQTGQPRWRFKAPCGPVQVTRCGRVLIVSSPDGVLSAVDVANGELVWRFRDSDARFPYPPAISGETLVAVAGTSKRQQAVAFGIDLYSGQQLWKHTLAGHPAAAPFSLGCASGPGAVVAGMAEADTSHLVCLEATTGSQLWTSPDPGLSRHGAPLSIDDRFVVNTPGGTLTCLDSATGETVWSQQLSDSLGDEIPRRLEPVLRNGALFVPSAAVHILRPHDGQSIGASVCPHLVPDCFRVDERGWVYVAEESGLISAFASGPQLTLIEGGAGPIRAIRHTGN